MNWFQKKFWMWWFFECPFGYDFFGHENGRLFWFFPFGVNVRYKKGEYISIHLRSGLTQRTLDGLRRAAAKVSEIKNNLLAWFRGASRRQ